MSSPPPTTLPTTPRRRRASRFTEGSPLTGSQLTQQTADNSFLLSILSQMDEHEALRKDKQRSESNASTESFTFSSFTGRSRRDTGSSNGGSSGGSGSSNGGSPVQGEFTGLGGFGFGGKERVGRRSITFGARKSGEERRSLQVDERPREMEGTGVGEGLKGIFKGRLRALTGGRERSVKPYEGT